MESTILSIILIIFLIIIVKVCYDYITLINSVIYNPKIDIILDKKGYYSIRCRKGLITYYYLNENNAGIYRIAYFKTEKEAIEYAEKVYNKYLDNKKNNIIKVNNHNIKK